MRDNQKNDKHEMRMQRTIATPERNGKHIFFPFPRKSEAMAPAMHNPSLRTYYPIKIDNTRRSTPECGINQPLTICLPISKDEHQRQNKYWYIDGSTNIQRDLLINHHVQCKGKSSRIIGMNLIQSHFQYHPRWLFQYQVKE